MTVQAGNMNDYKSLSQFETLAAFNEHYRKLTYTFAELFEQKETYKRILSSLFKLAKDTIGVAFVKRETLAKAASCSPRSVDNFIKEAATFGITIEKALGRSGKRKGGYAHNTYTFGPIDGLSELPSATECEASCEALLQTVEESKPLEPQAIEVEKDVPNHDSFKQDYPSELKELKDLNTYVQDVQEVNVEESIDNDIEKNKTEYAAALGIEKEIVTALAGFSFNEIRDYSKAIKNILKNQNTTYSDVQEAVIAALRAFKYFYNEAQQGRFTMHSPIKFLAHNVKTKVDKYLDEKHFEYLEETGTAPSEDEPCFTQALIAARRRNAMNKFYNDADLSA